MISWASNETIFTMFSWLQKYLQQKAIVTATKTLTVLQLVKHMMEYFMMPSCRLYFLSVTYIILNDTFVRPALFKTDIHIKVDN